jgi:F-type H+-transporting ATPase subunit gamma
MKKSVSDVTNLSDYISEIKSVINKIKSESLEQSRLFDNNVKSGSGQNELVIIFASNKGLCGSFNTNVYKKTKRLVEENPNIKYAICFGKFAEKVARKLNLEVKLSIIEIEKVLHPTQVFKVENFAHKMYLNGEVNKVWAVYTNFIKMGIYEPRAVTLYPVDKNLNTLIDEVLSEDGKVSTNNSLPSGEGKGGAKQLYTFEPNIQTLIEKTIPKIIKMILFSFVLESRASENSARSMAMKRANESAGEMLGTLKVTFNKIRQDSITQEIAEISAGANAG